MDSERIKSIALTDRPNDFATIASVAVNSADKSMGIAIAYIRDNASNLRLSFIDGVFNLADLATRIYGNRQIYSEFLESDAFRISFLGRKTVDAALRVTKSQIRLVDIALLGRIFWT